MERVVKSKQVGVKACVQEFLGLVFSFDYDDYNKRKRKPMGVQREREIEAEIRGFNKAQEVLRDLIAVNGTDSILHLSELRVEGQREPQLIGDKRYWVG